MCVCLEEKLPKKKSLEKMEIRVDNKKRQENIDKKVETERDCQ